MRGLGNAVKGVDVASTVIVLVFILISFLVNHGRTKGNIQGALPRTALRIIFIAPISLAYISEAILAARRRQDITLIQDHVVASVIFAFIWGFILLRKRLILGELFGLSLISFTFSIPLFARDIVKASHNIKRAPLLSIQSARLLLIFLLLTESSARLLMRNTSPGKIGENETTPFLSTVNEDPDPSEGSYGTAPAASLPKSVRNSESSDGESSDSYSDSDTDDDDDEGSPKSRTGQLRKSGSWMIYLKHFNVFLPLLIPKTDFKVQACILLCILGLIAERFLNILVPQQLGVVADKLFAGDLPYAQLGIYFVLDFLHGDSGIEMIISLARIPIKQFSFRQLTNAAFNHVMSLSMEFHSDRDSAEVMKGIEQGGALTRILETAVLEMMPTVLDMGVAFVFLYLKFNSSVALCMLAASCVFIVVEVTASDWNIENRRKMTKMDRREARVMHQAVQGWQTVSAFNMFSYEKSRFGSAVDEHLAASKNWSQREAVISAVSYSLVPITFFLMASLVAHEIYFGHASPGDFVFLTQYWDYLIWPIKTLSHEYRYVMSDLIDAERLLDLLTTEPTVSDKVDAISLTQVKGHVDLEDVRFSYDDKRIAVHDINISAAAGETVALVGTTGAGKSTLIKLLMRYYDVTSGSIKIDGHDLRDITQGSLRDAIGVVPQDPLLFNASIMENLRYARISASDDDIYDACRAAAIHDKILTFTDGYDTKVGEQGVKLSGGEVQRLAIARVFLKDPPILILDEATSAVDTETEADIQGALRKLSRKRTTFVIAHRLSTVVGATRIFVLENGTVIEKGTHEELLQQGVKYPRLWQKQLGDTHDTKPDTQ